MKCTNCSSSQKVKYDGLCEVCFHNKRDAYYFKRFTLFFLVFALVVTIGVENWQAIKSFFDFITDWLILITPDFVKTYLLVLLIGLMPCGLLFVVMMNFIYERQDA